MTFVTGATKINLKNFKTYLWWNGVMQETIWRHNLYSDGRFEPSANSGRSLTWPYELKALKSSLKISETKLFKVSLINLLDTCDGIVVCITVMLPIQEFYITMMMLIFSIVVICLCFYWSWLVFRVLNNNNI